MQKQQQSFQNSFKELPALFQGLSQLPDQSETPHLSKRNSMRRNKNLQISFATEENYVTQNFNKEELIILVLFILNSIIYFNFKKDQQKIILSQIVISLVNGFILLTTGIIQTTLPLLLVIIATIFSIVISPLLNENRQFIIIPLLYIIGFKGIKNKIWNIGRAIQKYSFYMFLSLALLFYVFGYISYYVFWKDKKYFKTPVHSSITLLQVSTLDSIGQIISEASTVSGLPASIGILISTAAVFQLIYNINQALIIQIVHQREISYNINQLFQTLLSIYGITINIDLRIFRYINFISTSAIFVIPFKPNLSWLYCLLTGTSTLVIFLYEFGKGSIFGFRSIFNIALQTSIVIAIVCEDYHFSFVLCCFRIFLIKQVCTLWKQIKKVIQKVYPMLSLIIVFYFMFTMLIFCLQKDSLKNTFITTMQILVLDDWSNRIRNYPWYMKITLLTYMLIGSHILLNSLVSQAFSSLQYYEQSNVNSLQSDSCKQSLSHLPPEKVFVNILKQLKFQGFNQFKGRNNRFINGNYDFRQQQWQQQFDDQQYYSDNDEWSQMKQQQIIIQANQRDTNNLFQQHLNDQNLNHGNLLNPK